MRPTSHHIPSTCWECSTTCGGLLDVRNDRVVDIRPNRNHPGSRGAFCAKGIRALPHWTYGERRVLHPLKRSGARGDGNWQQLSFDAAMDEVAEKLLRVHQRDGPLAIAGAVSGAFFSRGAIMALLMRALGSPNWMINQDLCGGCRGVSDKVTGLGITGSEDIDHARVALVVGRNAYAADPVQWRALNAMKSRGGRLVVIDPNATPASKRADIWLRPRPGTDAAIALAMIHVMVSEKRYDAQFVNDHCIGFDQLEARANRYPPSVAAELTGVSAQDIVRAARCYADGPSVFISGHGIDAFSAGFQTFRAFHCLVAISGNVERTGGNLRNCKPQGMLNYLDVIHHPRFQLPAQTAQLTLGAQQYPLWAGPSGWQTACHNPTVIDAVLTSKPYPVRALYISGVNIAVTYPNPRRTIEALRSVDALVVAAHDINPTSAWADIVLPKTTTLEEEEVQIQPRAPCVSYTQPAHPPLGEARCDVEIASALLDRLSPHIDINRDLLPWHSQREFNRFLLGESDIDLETLATQGYASFERPPPNTTFNTPSGKIELYSAHLASLGHDPLPDFVPPAAGLVEDSVKDQYPLLLLTGERDKNYHHSRFRDQHWLREQTPHPVLRVHPATLVTLGITDGEWVEITTMNGPGTFQAVVESTDRVPPEVVATGMGWWYPEAQAPWFGLFEVNVNAALSYGGPYDPVVGSPDSRGLRCRIERMAS